MKLQMYAGIRAIIPLSISVATYGSVLGVLAAQKSINLLELLMMNVLLFAGTSQFVMVEMWHSPMPILEVTLAILMINIRYFLASALLKPVFRESSTLCKFFSVHLLVDENWAVTLAAQRTGRVRPAFLVGSGLCLMLAWNLGTLFGYRIGNLVNSPEKYALDFAFTAVFTALLFTFWRGKQDIFPWLVTAILALVSNQVLSGKWYIIIGSVGGALFAAWRSPKNIRENL
ncbi:AzlC family ABC transporter permease [Nostoc commune]|uniref:AzlC family ABC transporter permease n=1 Tax=Nostoc commune TaxID=1178 RepID=UPI0018C47161|nr:AzlC family ABC transporter permease [Nostoc commune]MBG1261746.1 AzlC family ABC transporter permease [Nostoc commune BAE]